MAASDLIKHLYDGTIQLSDGTATPVVLVVPFSTGDLSISGLQQLQKAVAKYETRGKLNSVRHTSRTYPSGSFSFQIADYSDVTDATLLDFVLKQGSFNTNVSTLTNSSEVYAFDLTLTVEGVSLGDAADHTMVLTDCVSTLDISEGEPNSGTLSFEVLGTVTFT